MTMTTKQVNAIWQIATFYDDFDAAKEILEQAAKGRNRYFVNEEITLHLLANEKALFAKRKKYGVKSPESILRNTLDSSPVNPPSGFSAPKSGFDYLRWQENSGP